jgi:hypothetical protein
MAKDTNTTDYERIARGYLSDDYKPGAIVALALPDKERRKAYYFEFQKRKLEWIIIDRDEWRI